MEWRLSDAGGAGSNGVVMPPIGLNAAGETRALMRGFAVVSTDTGHKSHHPGFDFAFERDQQAYLDFAYLANAEVANLAKQLIGLALTIVSSTLS
jgi:Tannase and feruloyl esterase